MTDPSRKLEDLEWVGGHPSLDYVNTVHAWTGDTPGAEYLLAYADLLDWHRTAGLIGAGSARAFGAAPAADRAAALESALALRGALRSIFHSLATAGPIRQAALDHLNEVLQRTAPWRRLEASDAGVRCRWDFAGAPPEAILGPVAWNAAELLEHGKVDRIRECPPGDGCGWLFLDSSKNRSRTWCSMKTCGNTAKVKRFRARREDVAASGKRRPR
jgi:predicted RNA-binding Zn ribbon-like protein